MAFEIIGRIAKVLPLQQGVSKDNKEWQKQLFVVKTPEQYNNTYCFEIFGTEKVEDFSQRFRQDMEVKVNFNVNTNEWQEKFYTSLSVWKIDGVGQPAQVPTQQNEVPPSGPNEDLPF